MYNLILLLKASVHYLTNLLINTRDARRRWGAPTNASTVMTAYRFLPSAMRSHGDKDWSVHSLLLSLNDLGGFFLRRLPSTVPFSMIFGRVL